MINTTIAKLALQALLGRRRFFLLLAFPVLLIGLVALVAALVDGDAAYEVLPDLGYPLVLPLVAILAASSVLGPEVDDGSIVYLLSKPVNRYGIAISKWLVALGATLAAGALPIFVAALITGDSTRATGALFVGAVVAGTAYSALFLAISAVTRHAVDRVADVRADLGGPARQPLQRHRLAEHRPVGPAHRPRDLQRPARPRQPGYAIIASLVVTVVGAWFAGDRLRSFSLRGED